MSVTLLVRRASARRFAPWCPIWLSFRVSTVNDCAKRYCIGTWSVTTWNRFTVLYRRASARRFAPSSSIWFSFRSSVFNVYAREESINIDEGKDIITVFCRKASARCFAPRSRIRFLSKLIATSVWCLNIPNDRYDDHDERDKALPYCIEEHQRNIVSHRHQFDYERDW